MDRLIVITKEGTVRFLYEDDHPLLSLGDVQIVRASDVRFDNKAKRWFMHEKKTDGSERRQGEGFIRRKDAIAFEIEVLEKRLEVDPMSVDRMFDND